MGRLDKLKVAGRLRALREEKGLTQTQLAGICNVADKTVARWERGERLPEPHIFAGLMLLYQANFRFMLGLIETKVFISADSIDIDLWRIWWRLDGPKRDALKDMARFLEGEKTLVEQS